MKAREWWAKFLRSRSAGIADDNWERGEIGEVAEALRSLAPAAPPIDSAFMTELDQRLMRRARVELGVRKSRTIRRTYLARRLAVALGLAVLLIFGAFLSAPLRRGQSAVSPSSALASSYKAFQAVSTVKYRVAIDQDGGSISAKTRDGMRATCTAKVRRQVSQGEYDATRQGFHDTEEITMAEDATCSENPLQPMIRTEERVQVQGVRYARTLEGDLPGGWRELSTPTCNGQPCGWPLPIGISRHGHLWFGDIEDGKDSYDTAEVLARTQIDGVLVDHYRLARAHPDGTREATEVWIGTADRLPRKIVLELLEPVSRQALLQQALDILNSAPPSPPGLDLPPVGPEDIVIVAERIPQESYTRYEFTLWGFNEPVNIEVPPPQDVLPFGPPPVTNSLPGD